MICAGRRVFWVMAGVLSVASIAGSQAEAGFLIRNPYVEGRRVFDRPRLIGSTGTQGYVCPEGFVATTSTGDTSSGKDDQSRCWTNTTLVLSVPENADVCVNGQETEKKRLAGVHRNTRTVSFVGLNPGEHRKCFVKASLGTREEEKTVTLIGGKETKARITLASYGKAATSNAGRDATYTTQRTKPIYIHVKKYKDEGNVEELHFDGAMTPPELKFKATSEKFKGMTGFTVNVRYLLTLKPGKGAEIPQKEPVTFCLTEDCEAKETMVFTNEGEKCSEMFTTVKLPDGETDADKKTLGYRLKAAIRKHASSLHGDASIKVEIVVVCKEKESETWTEVAKFAEPLELQLKYSPK